MLRAGVSFTDISPKPGVQLAGYPHCPRHNKGVHDPLFASCLYLDNGKSDIVIVTLDLLYFGKEYTNELRKKTGKNIIFSATHTHSAPWSSTIHNLQEGEESPVDENYIASLMEKLEKMINETVSSTFDALLGTVSAECGYEQGIGGNRRVPFGLNDPSVNIIAVTDQENKLRACLVNYTLHPTYLHADNELVSGDYPSYIRRYLNFAYPDSVIMFAQGTAGNQSSRYHRVGQSYDEAARAGTTIGVEVFHALRKIHYSSNIQIGVSSGEVELPIRKFPAVETVEKAMNISRARFASMDSSNYIRKRNAELDMFGAENKYNFTKSLSDGTFFSNELPCEVQTIILGDTLIVGIQGELFVEYGLMIKKISPFAKTFIFAVSNGSLPGYIYTPDSESEGGYEVGNSLFSGEAGNVLYDYISGKLKSLSW